MSSSLPPQKVVLTVNGNKIQLVDIICEQLVGKVLANGEPRNQRLIISGREAIPDELCGGLHRKRDDLRTTHEEADVIMVHQVLKLAQNGARSIKVISDDTDVFVLLMHFCEQQDLSCHIIMESTSSERALVDIQASVENNKGLVPHLLAAHGLTGCDTVAKLHGIGKGTVVKKLKEGYTFNHLGNLDSAMDDAVLEATDFISACYGSKMKGDLSEIRVEMWSKKMGKKNVTAAPDLKSIPPTSEAFRENVLRAHIQVAVWKSAPEADPPSFDPTKYGWLRDEATKTLTPVTLPADVALAPPEVLELLRCGCATDEPCSSLRCRCGSGHLPCTFFCACRGGTQCRNPYNQQKETDMEEEDDENIDLEMD